MAVPTIAASATDLSAASPTITITLPTYLATDALILILAQSSNNLPTSWSSNVTATLLGSGGNRLTAWLLVPTDTAQTTVTATFAGNTNAQWHVGAYRGGEPAAIVAAGLVTGSNTTADLPAAPIAYPTTSTGNELVVAVGATSASPGAGDIWPAATATTIWRTTSGVQANADARPLPAGVTNYTPANFNRGVEGTTRVETALTFILPPAGTALTSASAGDFYALLLP